MGIREIVTKMENNRLGIVLHNEFYQQEAIRAACYKFTGTCTILIRPSDEWEIEVIFEPIAKAATDLTEIAKQFCNEVLDQQVRLDLERRYGKLRELIVRQAFAPVKDIEAEIAGDE